MLDIANFKQKFCSLFKTTFEICSFSYFQIDFLKLALQIFIAQNSCPNSLKNLFSKTVHTETYLRRGFCLILSSLLGPMT
jgi:hypothetical protein